MGEKIHLCTGSYVVSFVNNSSHTFWHISTVWPLNEVIWIYLKNLWIKIKTYFDSISDWWIQTILWTSLKFKKANKTIFAYNYTLL